MRIFASQVILTGVYLVVSVSLGSLAAGAGCAWAMLAHSARQSAIGGARMVAIHTSKPRTQVVQLKCSNRCQGDARIAAPAVPRGVRHVPSNGMCATLLAVTDTAGAVSRASIVGDRDQ